MILIDRKYHLKYTHRGFMADWIHKEGTWQTSQEMSFDDEKIMLSGFDIGFVEWLDSQCEGGWEVCHIAIISKGARFSSGVKTANWCVFRKKTDE